MPVGVAPRFFERRDFSSGVGLLFGGILLSALADVAPEVAAPLGLLMVVGVLLTPKSGGTSPGQELIRSVSTVTAKKG